MSQTKLPGEPRTQEKGGDALPQGQGKLNTVGVEAHSSQTFAMTVKFKDSRTDLRGSPALTAVKPNMTPFNNTSCCIPPNDQQAN